MAELPYFGDVELGSENRPGPILQLLENWLGDAVTDPKQHFADSWGPDVAEFAKRVDATIKSAAEAFEQHREGQRYGKQNLRKIVIVTTVGGLHDLDEVVELCEALSPFGCEHYADNAFNFRNCAVPYKRGEPLFHTFDEKEG